MTSNKTGLVFGALVLLVVGFILGVIGLHLTAEAPAQTEPVEQTQKVGDATTYDASNLVGDVYQGLLHQLVFRNGAFVGIEGGGIYATSTSGATGVITSDYFDTESRIDVMLNSQSATLTFAASSTLSNFLPTGGTSRTIWIRNATTTAAISLTIAGGTGIQLKNSASSTATLIGDTDGKNMFQVVLQRLTTGGDFVATVTRFQVD